MSDSAFAAATWPKTYGSSTIGAKKSTVWTSAMSSDNRKTPASSIVSWPTSRRGSEWRGSPSSAFDRSPGPSLAAQPAQRANAVSRKISFLVALVDMSVSVGTEASGEFVELGDRVDLDENAAGQARHLNGRTRG